MAKTPEQIQKDLIDRFGLQIDLEKCKNYSQAYSVISNLATIGYINVVNEGKLKEVVGNREDFQKALNENEHIENKSVKAFYFYHYASNPMSKGKDRISSMPLNQEEKIDEKVKNEINLKIIRIASDFGLAIQNNSLLRLIKDKKIVTVEQVNEELILECALSQENKYGFKLINNLKARKSLERLSFGLGIYKDEFVNRFLDSRSEVALRHDKRENEFLGSLDKKGIYITYIDDSIPSITNIKELEEALKSNSSGIKIVGLDTVNIYDGLADYMIESSDFEQILANNMSETLFDKEKNKDAVKEVREFEDSLGIKIYSYITEIPEAITTEGMVNDIICGNSRFFICDAEKLKEKIKDFPLDVQEAFEKRIKEKDAALTVAQERKEGKEEKLEPEDKEQQILTDKTKEEEIVKNMVVEKYKLFGRDYTIHAMKLCVKENNFEEFPDENGEISKEAVLMALASSYTKRVVLKMKENDIGNNENSKENLMENAIAELYRKAIETHDAKLVVDFISNCIYEKIVDEKRKTFPEGMTYLDDVNSNISSKDILKIMVGSEIDVAMKEKDENGNPKVPENSLDKILEKYENAEDRLELTENKFVNSTNKNFKTSSERNSASATIYASLSQKGANENGKIVNLIKEHSELKKKIEGLRNQIVALQEKVNNAEKGTTDYNEKEGQLRRLKEKLEQQLINYEQMMIVEQYKDQNDKQREKLMVIGEYEGKIKVLHQLDTKKNYINKDKKSEVIDIE